MHNHIKSSPLAPETASVSLSTVETSRIPNKQKFTILLGIYFKYSPRFWQLVLHKSPEQQSVHTLTDLEAMSRDLVSTSPTSRLPTAGWVMAQF